MTTFLNCALIFSLLFILILYLNQRPNKLTSNNTLTNKELAIQQQAQKARHNALKLGIGNQGVQSHCGMPVHRTGPIHNFHQSFAFTINKPNPIIPQMGWRNYYLANFNKYQVTEQDPFAGTPIRNFLNNLENVDNLYKKCL
jgi:hypothetical protein